MLRLKWIGSQVNLTLRSRTMIRTIFFGAILGVAFTYGGYYFGFKAGHEIGHTAGVNDGVTYMLQKQMHEGCL